jgi:hypothetical protein
VVRWRAHQGQGRSIPTRGSCSAIQTPTAAEYRHVSAKAGASARASQARASSSPPFVSHSLLQSKRLLIESRWVTKPLALAGKMRPRRPNN